jgi:hypothetical protein
MPPLPRLSRAKPKLKPSTQFQKAGFDLFELNAVPSRFHELASSKSSQNHIRVLPSQPLDEGVH